MDVPLPGTEKQAYTICLSNAHYPPFALSPIPSPVIAPTPVVTPYRLRPPQTLAAALQPLPSAFTRSRTVKLDTNHLYAPTPGQSPLSPTPTSKNTRYLEPPSHLPSPEDLHSPIKKRSMSVTKSLRMSPRNKNAERDRDTLSINTFTVSLDRETLFSRASSVANILRSLGPSVDDRSVGVGAICAYVEGKRSRGKTDEEIRKKVGVLEGMVPTDLGDVFVKASIRSGLARRTALSSPTPSGRMKHRRTPTSTSISSLSSIETPPSCHTSPPPLPPLPPPPSLLSAGPSSPSTSPSSSPSDRLIPYTPHTPDFSVYTPSTPPTDLVSPATPNSGESAFTWSLSSPQGVYEDSDSSFSAPAPVPPYTSNHETTGTPSAPIEPDQQTHGSVFTSESGTSTPASSIGRTPTLLSPLAMGGWGRQWERPLFSRPDLDRLLLAPRAHTHPQSTRLFQLYCGADKDQRDARPPSSVSMFDDISLESFPEPPERYPPAESAAGATRDQPAPKLAPRLIGMTVEVAIPGGSRTNPRNHLGGLPPCDNIASSGMGREMHALQTGRTIDTSWLSISDSTSSGLLTPPTGTHPPARSSEGTAEIWKWDEERTITGVESSRWSAVWSEVSNTDAPPDFSHAPDGPTEASLIRDAYLNMLYPPKMEYGPEQGDSHALLMAYA